MADSVRNPRKKRRNITSQNTTAMVKRSKSVVRLGSKVSFPLKLTHE